MDRTNYVKIFLNQSILVFPAIAIGAGSGHGKWWQYSGKSVGQLLAGKLSIYLLPVGILSNTAKERNDKKIRLFFLYTIFFKHQSFSNHHQFHFYTYSDRCHFWQFDMSALYAASRTASKFNLLVGWLMFLFGGKLKICYLSFSGKKMKQIFLQQIWQMSLFVDPWNNSMI